MKKIFLFFIITTNLFFSGCENLKVLERSQKDYSIIENKIKEGKIIIKNDKIFYKQEFDIFTSSDEEVELLKEYANDKGLVISPIKN